MTSATIIEQTNQWVNSVVIGCNFCPFAAKSVLQKRIRYEVFLGETLDDALASVVKELEYLDENEEIETTLLIFPKHFEDFMAYLDLAETAEDMSIDEGYEGIYQIASFHPDYCFDGATDDDPANYTNRSPYPMLHILREDTLTKVLDHYIDPEGIPERNIAFAKEKGLEYMKGLLASCME
ncbi:MAG: DUF1415 domain-containing protein [Bacteroidota bacterium]